MARVCIIGPSKRFFSGISAYTICLANALSMDNEVSALLMRNLLPRFLYPGKGQIGRVDHSLHFGPGIVSFDGMDWNSPLSGVRAYRFLKQQRPEVIVMQWWTSSVAHMQLFLAIVNRLRIGARLILEMHEVVDPLEESILPIRLYSRVVGKLLTRKTDAFIVHSPSMVGQVAQIYHINPDKVSVIHHGLYVVYYQSHDRESAMDELGIKAEFVILYFGLIRRYKGVPCLVEAFNKLPPEIALRSRLVIAGEDWGDEPSLANMVKSSPYKEQIAYRPTFIPEDRIPYYFSAADVVVLPYIRTAGSGVASIAMAYGKPIITSDVVAMRECLTGYEGARFGPVGDSAAIADRLVQIYGESRSGERLTHSPPQNTWHEVARRFGQMLKQLDDR